MNKKIIAAIIAAIIIVVGAYFAFYVPYQNDILNDNYNEGLQNASAIETQIISLTEQFNNQESTDADTLINTLNKEIIPKYSEEISVLNKTAESANGNSTKIRYIELQTKRLELESKNINGTITTLNAISQLVKGEKSNEDAQASINKANEDITESQKELNTVLVDIKTFLTQHPEFNDTLQDLHLEKPFVGESRVQAQAQAAENNTQ